MDNSKTFYGSAALLAFGLTIVFLGFYGWVANLIVIAHSVSPIGGLLLLRIIGVFIFPIGCVLGFM